MREGVSCTTNDIDLMKKWIWAALLLPALLCACAGIGHEEKDVDHEMEVRNAAVPIAVREAFAERFPAAANVEWELEDPTRYEGVFQEGGTESSANFAANGAWLETESRIAKSALPKAVTHALAANYADHIVEEAERVETPEGITFELGLVRNASTTEVLFAEDGHVISAKLHGVLGQGHPDNEMD